MYSLYPAKAVGENGFEVALLEREIDLTVRVCGEILDFASEYLYHDLYRCNVRDKVYVFLPMVFRSNMMVPTEMHPPGRCILLIVIESKLVSVKNKRKTETIGRSPLCRIKKYYFDVCQKKQKPVV